MTDLLTQLRDYGRQIEIDPMLSAEAPPIVDPATRPPRPRFGRGLAWALAAFAVVLTVGGLYFAFIGTDGQVVDQATVPTPTTVVSEDEVVVHGWPSTTENPAGVYSWDGTRCAGESCVDNFMHNGYGSGDVEIRFNVAGPLLPTHDDATAVTVAGHNGTYRRIDVQREEWRVDIEGKTTVISLAAEPGTSQADLAEAHAIIDSIRAEPSDNRAGFRLVFTLTTDDWDSG